MQTNIIGMLRSCWQSMDHTGFAPAHGVCLSWSVQLRPRVLCMGTVQSGLCISCTSQVSAAQVQVLG